VNQETRDLYSVTGTIYSSGITNAELEQRENSRSREDLPRWHSDLRQKIAAELASFTEEDSRGVTSAAPRVALTQTPEDMRRWSAPDEWPTEDSQSDIRSAWELVNIADQIHELLMLYRAKRNFWISRAGAGRRPFVCADGAVLRMIEIATTDEGSLEATSLLARCIGSIPAEHCPEAVAHWAKREAEYEAEHEADLAGNLAK